MALDLLKVLWIELLNVLEQCRPAFDIVSVEYIIL